MAIKYSETTRKLPTPSNTMVRSGKPTGVGCQTPRWQKQSLLRWKNKQTQTIQTESLSLVHIVEQNWLH